jgi:dCMP deaminase
MLDISEKDLMLCVRVSRILGSMSRATRARVGCVIFDVKQRNIVSIGYNGTPAGSDNTMEIDNITLPSVIHAEVNAMNKLDLFTRIFNKNLVMIVTHSPCAACAQMIIDKTKISTVYYLDNYGKHDGILLLRASGKKLMRVVEK